MYEQLKERLWAYIELNNPEFMHTLVEEGTADEYLKGKITSVVPLQQQLQRKGKPTYVTLELCLEALTQDLRPSKYRYIKNILEEEFPGDYLYLQSCGLLEEELLAMLETCKKTLEDFGFSEDTMDDRGLRYAVIADLHDYLAK